jgi:hypothetical protein
MSRRRAVILDLVTTVGQSLASRTWAEFRAKLLGRVGDREMANLELWEGEVIE